MSLQQKNQHLMWRAGFGPAAAQLPLLKTVDSPQLFKALQKASAHKPGYMDVADDYLKGFFLGAEEIGRQQRKKELEPEERKKIRQKQRESIKSLNLRWLSEMVHTKAQLREKMALFWHGHFASRNINVFYQQQLLHIIRSRALGSFRDLLHEVSQSAAMLNFLNAAQNRKDHPNENFAREVMELFTLGRGYYTEEDIREAARAFTGWSANLRGEFVFRRFQHDSGTKTIFGKRGAFTGTDVLDLLLEQKQTAAFITRKLYRYFVNETADEAKIEWLSDRFYQSDYNIARLTEDIFTADWFYEEKNRGNRIKSPIELIVGLQRMLPMTIEAEESLLLLQRILGQVLFYPPNVAGWPGGKAWIDSSTLMLRLRLPQLIQDTDEWNVQAKDDDDQMMGRSKNEEGTEAKTKKKWRKPVRAQIDWETFVQQFEKTPREALVQSIAGALFQTKTQPDPNVVQRYADSSRREAFIKTVAVQLMGTPEYQLC